MAAFLSRLAWWPRWSHRAPEGRHNPRRAAGAELGLRGRAGVLAWTPAAGGRPGAGPRPRCRAVRLTSSAPVRYRRRQDSAPDAMGAPAARLVPNTATTW